MLAWKPENNQLPVESQLRHTDYLTAYIKRFNDCSVDNDAPAENQFEAEQEDRYLIEFHEVTVDNLSNASEPAMEMFEISRAALDPVEDEVSQRLQSHVEDVIPQPPVEDNFDDQPVEDEPVQMSLHAFDQENLVAAPRLANRDSIAYARRDKVINMQEVRNAIWRLLTTSSRQSHDREVTLFSEVYRNLPRMVSEQTVQVLSISIVFVALLHVANERNLRLRNIASGDIEITQD